jgi:hypothetical protein
MKTAIDSILEGQQVSIVHEGHLLNVSPTLIELIKRHYNNNVLDNITDERACNYFSFDYPMEEFDGRIESHVRIEYKNECIKIFVVHDSVTCNVCDGDGKVEDWFEDDDNSDEMIDCKQCYGSGGMGIYDTWEEVSYNFYIDLPEEVHHKTIILNQGELF